MDFKLLFIIFMAAGAGVLVWGGITLFRTIIAYIRDMRSKGFFGGSKVDESEKI